MELPNYITQYLIQFGTYLLLLGTLAGVFWLLGHLCGWIETGAEAALDEITRGDS